MKRIIIILSIFLIAGSAFAEFSKVGSAGAQFLKIGVGSRYQAMGEASVATVNDVYGAYWNPAGLAEIENSAVGFTTVNWVLDVDLNYASFAHYFEDVGTFGVSASVLTMGDQEITTFDQQDGTGDYYSATSYAVGLSYSRYLTHRFAFGGTVKYVGERIHNVDARGFAFDFGTLLHTGYRSLRLAMSISNLGPEMKFSGTDLDVPYSETQSEEEIGPTDGAQLKTTGYDLPMVFRFGLAYDVDFGNNAKLTLASELKHPNDNVQQGSLGAEFNFQDQYFLRSGYKINYDEEGLTLGGGLRTSLSSETRLLIDYAWQDFGRLESTHRFSLGFTF